MSAAVCGSKRAFFEELPPSPPLSKRLRCSSSTSPIRFPPHSLIDLLRNLFPHMNHLVNNYTLAMHLGRAHQSINPFHGRFPPDVF